MGSWNSQCMHKVVSLPGSCIFGKNKLSFRRQNGQGNKHLPMENQTEKIPWSNRENWTQKAIRLLDETLIITGSLKSNND